jgi:hypothetical protein
MHQLAAHSKVVAYKQCGCCCFPCSAVRDAAIECLEEVHKVLGAQLVDIIDEHKLRFVTIREIYARLGLGAPQDGSPDSQGSQRGGSRPGSCAAGGAPSGVVAAPTASASGPGGAGTQLGQRAVRLEPCFQRAMVEAAAEDVLGDTASSSRLPAVGAVARKGTTSGTGVQQRLAPEGSELGQAGGRPPAPSMERSTTGRRGGYKVRGGSQLQWGLISARPGEAPAACLRRNGCIGLPNCSAPQAPTPPHTRACTHPHTRA